MCFFLVSEHWAVARSCNDKTFWLSRLRLGSLPAPMNEVEISMPDLMEARLGFLLRGC